MPQKLLIAYLMCAAIFKPAPVGLFFCELNPWAIIAVIGLQYLKRRLSNLPHRWVVARENCDVLRWRNLKARESKYRKYKSLEKGKLVPDVQEET